MIKFKYNGKIYKPVHPENKLKKLGITWDDVEIIENQIKEEVKEERQNPKLYIFKNKNTDFTIESIYDNLDHLENVVADINDYDFIGMKKYE